MSLMQNLISALILRCLVNLHRKDPMLTKILCMPDKIQNNLSLRQKRHSYHTKDYFGGCKGSRLSTSL